MNYLPRNKPVHAARGRALRLAGLFVLMALIFSLADGALVRAVSTVWKAENAFSRTIRRVAGSWRDHQSLIRENEELKARVASLELERGIIQSSSEYNRVVAEMLSRKSSEAILAAVLTMPPQSPYDLVVVDAGSRDGVSLGAIVAMPEGPLLGTVSDVFAASSKVKLFSTSGERTHAQLERHNVPVIIEGRGGGNFRIEVPRDVAVEVGDRVLSPDLGGALLAVVGAVEAEPTDAFKEVLARSPANVFLLRFVTILK